ncbi:MAG: TIGR03936 family radical SAM-associated protein [Candidatus Omnitrophica bacterium]|nr:TIGR03936 family radical SAM-associated protein [Candidatus Omnitrophota bacterium]
MFQKTADMRFISHLDLVRLFQRALRRAGFPVTITKGFSPRLKVSITRALKLGVESESEEAVISLDKPVDAENFMALLNKQLPAGIKVTGAQASAEDLGT